MKPYASVAALVASTWLAGCYGCPDLPQVAVRVSVLTVDGMPVDATITCTADAAPDDPQITEGSTAQCGRVGINRVVVERGGQRIERIVDVLYEDHDGCGTVHTAFVTIVFEGAT